MDKKYVACVAASIAMTIALIACTPTSDAGAARHPSVAFELSFDDTVMRFEDAEKGMTCWVFDGYKAGGIYCEHTADLLPKVE